MKVNHEAISIILIPSPDDLPIQTEEYQSDISMLETSMRSEGIDYTSRRYLIESSSGGFALGDFLVAAKSVAPVLSGLIGAWLQAKYGRKVMMKYGKVQIEAATVEDVERLISRLPKPQKKKKKQNNHKRKKAKP